MLCFFIKKKKNQPLKQNVDQLQSDQYNVININTCIKMSVYNPKTNYYEFVR